MHQGYKLFENVLDVLILIAGFAVFLKHRPSMVICIPETSLLSLSVCFHSKLITCKTESKLPDVMPCGKDSHVLPGEGQSLCS